MTTNSSLKPGVRVWHRYTGAEAVVADMHGAPGVVYVNPASAPGEVWLWKTGSVTTTPNAADGPTPAPGGVDPVDLPPHYRQLPVECIDVTEHFNFCLGNALKYIWRADHKGKPLEDLRKARWYIDREIARRVEADEWGDG